MKSKFLIIALLLINFIANAQQKEAIRREVIHHQNDSLYIFNIFIEKKDVKTNDSEWYFWYDNNTLYKNMGGYEGFLLDGEYKIYYQNKLVEKGEFKNGRKNKEWYYWNTTGLLLKKEIYRDGKLIETDDKTISAVTEPDSLNVKNKWNPFEGVFLKFKSDTLAKEEN